MLFYCHCCYSELVYLNVVSCNNKNNTKEQTDGHQEESTVNLCIINTHTHTHYFHFLLQIVSFIGIYVVFLSSFLFTKYIFNCILSLSSLSLFVDEGVSNVNFICHQFNKRTESSVFCQLESAVTSKKYWSNTIELSLDDVVLGVLKQRERKLTKSSPLRFYETREKQRCKKLLQLYFFRLEIWYMFTPRCQLFAWLKLELFAYDPLVPHTQFISILKVHTPPLYLKRTPGKCTPYSYF